MISNKPIIQHIEYFLDYCNVEKGLRNNTQKNYQEYLNKFFGWLKYKNLDGLLPHQLTPDHIWDYRLHLSMSRSGKSLQKTTQNYYLIALRAFLSYFVAKDIVSLPPGKVTLPKPDKSVKTANFLNSSQIKQLLGAPDIKKSIGLRDRIILEVLIGSGLKMNRLVALNIDNYINNINIDKNILLLIEKYLNTRKDKNEALFINYSGRKDANRRLTVRSIERIIKQYGQKIKLPFLITPESLRWNQHIDLFNEEIIINNPKEHKSLLINNYSDSQILKIQKEKNYNFVAQWNIIENKIEEEKFWLKNNINTMPEGYKSTPSLLKCDDCILRKLSILIVSGKIGASEFYNNSKNLWDNASIKSDEINKHHGKDWHKNMMNEIYRYFKQNNYKTILEPSLNHGRADLGAVDGLGKIIYIEVGTVSLYKLWYNLASMKNIDILVIPSENKILEFKK